MVIRRGLGCGFFSGGAFEVETRTREGKGMSGNERLDSKAGPLGNLSQAYFGSLDKMVKGCEPAFTGAGRWNLELVGLMSRRSQAWLEIPMRLARCKTPADIYSEQMRFWQSAATDYADGWQRLMGVWGACASMPRLNGPGPRDYMAVPEQKDTAKRSERKAA